MCPFVALWYRHLEVLIAYCVITLRSAFQNRIRSSTFSSLYTLNSRYGFQNMDYIVEKFGLAFCGFIFGGGIKYEPYKCE